MRFLSLWAPVVLHMGLIFAASSRSDLPPLPGTGLDKLIHAGIYALLGALVVRAIGGTRGTGLEWRHVAAAVLISALYGVTDEWHQSFVPGRTPDAWDVVADALGAGAGAMLALGARRRFTAGPPHA